MKDAAASRPRRDELDPKRDGPHAVWPVGGGQLGDLIRAFDWSTTSLGPVGSWSQTLRTATDILLHSPVAMVLLWGEDGVMIYNDAYSVFAGNRHPGQLGVKVREGWPEVADFNDHVMTVCLAGGTLSYQDQELTLYRTGRAEQVWMDLDYSPVLDEAGKPVGVLAIVIETTARVQMQRELLAERDRHRGVLNGMAEAFSLLDREFRILDVNAEATRLEGRRREALVGRSHWEAYPGTEHSELGQLYRRAMAKRVPVSLEHRYRLANGHETWIEMRAYPVEQGLAVFYRDITARKADEGALRASEARLAVSEASLRLATEAAEIGTWDLDLATDTLRWSDRTKAMFGISPDVPCSMVDFYGGLHPDDVETTTAAFISALDPASRTTYDVEYRTVGKEDGLVRWVAAKGKALFDDHGRCLRAIGTAIDITRRKLDEVRRLALIALSDRLRQAGDTAELAYAAAETLGRTFEVSRAGYGFLDLKAKTVTVERDWHVAEIRSLSGVRRIHQFGCGVEELERGQPIVLDGTINEPDAAALPGTRTTTDARAGINIPLTGHAGLVALLYVHHLVPRDWTPEEVAFAREIAERTRTAIERNRAEAELRDSEARLRAVFDAVPVGIVLADAPSGRISGGNVQAETIFGHPVLPSPDVEHYRDWVSFHSDGRQVEGSEYPLSRAMRGEADRPEMEVLYRRGDGRDVFVRLIAAAIRDEAGQVTGGVVAALDVDRQRRAEAALRDLNATLEQQVEERTAELDRVWRNSRDLLVVVGADGIFRAVNPAWTTILGYQAQDVVGRSFLDFVWPDDAELTQSGLDEATGTGDLTDFENRYKHQDGTPRWISWRTSNEGGLVYAYGRDITAEKEQAEALARAEEALRQSQKMEAVGQLTGGIAHDFNNMLAVVIGSLDLLGRRLGTADPRAKRYAEAAADGARRAALLTQRLLAFSRQQPLRPEPIDVNRLVAGMSDLIRGSMGGDVRLETVLAAGLWRVHADPNQLENVILNLAVNARDAMPEGGRLTIETQNAHLDTRYVAAHLGLSAGQYVLVAVTDTGTGMPSEVIAKAFDPFFTTKEIGKGTGLGLSQVYGFVKQSNGHVKIYSEPGQGTTIKIYLPRLTGMGSDTVEDEVTTDMPLGERGETVLVVEDEPAVRQFSVDALIELGYRVLEAEGAIQAWRLLDLHPEIALLFTDVIMPDVNGAKLAVEARRRRPDLKVLFTTGYTRNAVVHNGVLDPGVDLIGKPFTIEELAAKLREVLDVP